MLLITTCTFLEAATIGMDLYSIRTSFDIVAGNISFENYALFLEGEDSYRLVWNNTGKSGRQGTGGIENPILIVSMVEDVKEIGGSGYVVRKDRQVLEEWFSRN